MPPRSKTSKGTERRALLALYFEAFSISRITRRQHDPGSRNRRGRRFQSSPEAHTAAAESLTANIVDTMICSVGGNAKVIADAREPVDEDGPFVAYGELEAVKSIIRSMVNWYPNQGQPMPITLLATSRRTR